MRLKQIVFGTFLLFFITIYTTPVYASFTNIVALGDSLSDNGPVEGPDYYGIQRYTDGLTWVEQMANTMGIGLFNIAYGGATTAQNHLYDIAPNGIDVTGILGVQWQIDQIPLFPGLVGADTLVTLWAGANDYVRANRIAAAVDKYGTYDPLVPNDTRDPFINYLSETEQENVAISAVANIRTALDRLTLLGVMNILVPNLMDLAGDNIFSDYYNSLLADELLDFALTYTGTLYEMDIKGLFVGYDAQIAAGTLTQDELLWDDDYHPGSIVHTDIALLAAATIAPVPEPATMMLFGIGLLGLAGVSRRKK